MTAALSAGGPSAGGLPHRVRTGRTALAASLGVPAAMLYLALDWVRFSTGSSGNYDLGIFTQAAQRWAAGELPGSAIRSLPTLFADHFSPVTVLFGLGWLIWPDPRSLIIVQSLALGGAVAVIGAAAARTLPLSLALPVTATAALAKGFVAAASFDVHETALGTPLAAGLGWALLERRRRPALLCAAGLLLVKEDLGLTVAAAGAVWWLRSGDGSGDGSRDGSRDGRGLGRPEAADRRTALGLVALGLAGLLVANAVVIWAAPDHRSPYLQFLLGASGNPQGLAGAEVTGGSRWAPAALFALAAGVAGLRSPLALLAAPTLAWRAVSSNTSYWQTYFHYDALLVPVAALALTDVLRTSAVRLPGWRRRAALAAVAGAIAWSAVIGGAKVAAWRPWDPARWALAPRLQDAAALAAGIPRGAAVVVQQDLGPAVLARVDVRMLADTVPARARWVLLTPAGSQLGAPEAAKRAWLADVALRPGTQVTRRGECVLVDLGTEQTVEL